MALFHIGINASAVCWKTFIGIVWARCFHRVRSDLTSQWILLFYDSVFGSWKLKSKIQNSFFRKYCFVNSNYAPMRANRSLNLMKSLDPVFDHVCFQRFVAFGKFIQGDPSTNGSCSKSTHTSLGALIKKNFWAFLNIFSTWLFTTMVFKTCNLVVYCRHYDVMMRS